jgi:hypothetical protein
MKNSSWTIRLGVLYLRMVAFAVICVAPFFML